MSLCRHCQRRKGRPDKKGLCWGCAQVPAIRDLYPSTSKCARRGVGLGHHCHAPLPEPTDAQPGSEAKVAVLEKRAALAQNLWHPRDNGAERLPACLRRTGRVLARHPHISDYERARRTEAAVCRQK